MMLKILLVLFLFPAKVLFAQEATIKDDVASYRGKTFAEGDIVHLGYGSSADKGFSFVHYGKAPAGMKIPGLYHKANADWSKAEIEITKVYSEKGVVWIKGEPTNRGKNPGGLLGNKIFINLTGALDNREIISVEHNTGKASNKDLKKNLKLSKEELAAQLSDTKLKLKQALSDSKGKLKANANEVKLKVKGTASSIKQDLNAQVKTLKESGKNAVNDSKAKLKEQTEALKEKGKQTLKKTK